MTEHLETYAETLKYYGWTVRPSEIIVAVKEALSAIKQNEEPAGRIALEVYEWVQAPDIENVDADQQLFVDLKIKLLSIATSDGMTPAMAWGMILPELKKNVKVWMPIPATGKKESEREAFYRQRIFKKEDSLLVAVVACFWGLSEEINKNCIPFHVNSPFPFYRLLDAKHIPNLQEIKTIREGTGYADPAQRDTVLPRIENAFMYDGKIQLCIPGFYEPKDDYCKLSVLQADLWREISRTKTKELIKTHPVNIDVDVAEAALRLLVKPECGEIESLERMEGGRKIYITTVTLTEDGKKYVWEFPGKLENEKVFYNFGPKLWNTFKQAIDHGHRQNTLTPFIKYSEIQDLFEGDISGPQYERWRTIHSTLRDVKFYFKHGKGKPFIGNSPYLDIELQPGKDGGVRPFINGVWARALVSQIEGKKPSNYLAFPHRSRHKEQDEALLEIGFKLRRNLGIYPTNGVFIGNFLKKNMGWNDSKINTLCTKGFEKLLSQFEGVWERMKPDGDMVTWEYIPPDKIVDFLNDTKRRMMGFDNITAYTHPGGPRLFVEAREKFLNTYSKAKGYPKIPKLTAKNLLTWKVKFHMNKQRELEV